MMISHAFCYGNFRIVDAFKPITIERLFSNEIMYIQNQFNLLNVDITRLMKDFPIIHFTRGNIPKVFVNLIRGTYTSEIKSCLNMLRNL
jgi:hypothetical protein